MSIQSSTFNTSHVLDNEIIKASDFEFAFKNIVENVAKSTQMMLEADQDFVINGKVSPSSGMRVEIAPIYGVCKSTGVPFGRTESAVMEYAFSGSSAGRIDIIEVQGDWQTYDEQQRAFNDPDTDTQTYQYVDTKEYMYPKYRVIEGTEGSSIAPDVESGWVKLAEISIRANATSILASDIKNITSDIAGEDNDDWTNEKDVTFNVGYISDVNARFRVQHNSDGTHKDNSINSDSLDIGIGAKQINGNILPVGGNVNIATQTIANTDSILSVIQKAAVMINSIYNSYLKYGVYCFNNELCISSQVDVNNDLILPLKLSADGNGNAVLKIGTNTILSIDSNGKLTTNGYTATASNHLITKAVADGIRTDLSALADRVSALENSTGNSEIAINGVLSAERYRPANIFNIVAATTENITLMNSQTIDGVAVTTDDIVLVKDQTDKKENGIYVVSPNSVWQRASYAAVPTDMVGKIYQVQSGTTNAGKMFYLPQQTGFAADFGTDDIEISEYFGSVEPLANKLVMRDSLGYIKSLAAQSYNDVVIKCQVNFGTANPLALGTASPGTSSCYARADHVHPLIGIMAACISDGYFGLAPEGNANVYVRTGTCGLIPYVSDSTNGCGCVGTSTWPFKRMYAKIFCGNLCGTASYASSAGSATNATNACSADYASGAGAACVSCCTNATCWTGGVVCFYTSGSTLCVCNTASNGVIAVPDAAQMTCTLFKRMTCCINISPVMWLSGKQSICLGSHSCFSGLGSVSVKGLNVW